jgi:osmotically-inducible protein OsmY
MKSFVIGLLMGAIIAAGAIWYFAAGRTTPAVQKVEESAAKKAEQALESLQAAGEQAKLSLAAKLETLELRREDIQQELAEKGSIVRRKAREIGGAAADAALDARVTATIKAKLAADPELSVISIAVATPDGRVTLSGAVASPELIGKAIALALETEGVREVVSTIQIKKTG